MTAEKSAAVVERPISTEKSAEIAERPVSNEPHTQKDLTGDDGLSVDGKSLKEIIEEAEKAFSLEELRKSKPEEGAKRYLEEGRKQVADLCQCLEDLPLHTETRAVVLHIKLGEFLNEIKEWCDSNKGISKTTFKKWLDENFKDNKHRRYFFQARQLALMGEQAYQYAYLGKNRLLEFESVRKSISEIEGAKKTLKDVFNSQPLSSNGDSDNGTSKRHVDALITLYRFRNEGLKIVEFPHAKQMVSGKCGAITVGTVRQIKTVLDTVKPEKQKKESLDYYIKNKEFPEGLHPELIRKSPNNLLDGLVRYCDDIDFEDQDLVKRIKDKTEEKSVIEAYRKITMLAQRLGINLTQGQGSDSKANT